MCLTEIIGFKRALQFDTAYVANITVSVCVSTSLSLSFWGGLRESNFFLVLFLSSWECVLVYSFVQLSIIHSFIHPFINPCVHSLVCSHISYLLFVQKTIYVIVLYFWRGYKPSINKQINVYNRSCENVFYFFGVCIVAVLVCFAFENMDEWIYC